MRDISAQNNTQLFKNNYQAAKIQEEDKDISKNIINSSSGSQFKNKDQNDKNNSSKKKTYYWDKVTNLVS